MTQIKYVEPTATAKTTLDVPIFYLVDPGGASTQAGRSARSFLLQRDDGWLTDLGRPGVGEVIARGARVGDCLCVFDPEQNRQGCEIVTSGDDQLELTPLTSLGQDWQPEIQISPVTTITIDIDVKGIAAGLTLGARLYPADWSAPTDITLSPTIDGYTGTLTVPDSQSALEGYVHIFDSSQSCSGRDAITDYALGGNPGHVRSGAGHVRSGAGHVRSGAAPAMSSDGQFILFGRDLDFELDEFYTVQTATKLTELPDWASVVGQGYWLTASENAPDLEGASISIQYLGSQVPGGDERLLKIYYWNGAAWQRLDTEVNTDYNLASAQPSGFGLYALMSTLETNLHGPGWDDFTYTVPDDPSISTALKSINGKYTQVCRYVGSDDDNPWHCYGVDVPSWANSELTKLEKMPDSYWVYVTEDVTLRIKSEPEPEVASQATGALSPPATYYGAVLATEGFARGSGHAGNSLD